MSGLDKQLIDLIENSRCEKMQAILDHLPVVRYFVLPDSISKYLPDDVVVVGQLMDAVVIEIETRRNLPSTRIFYYSILGRPRR